MSKLYQDCVDVINKNGWSLLLSADDCQLIVDLYNKLESLNSENNIIADELESVFLNFTMKYKGPNTGMKDMMADLKERELKLRSKLEKEVIK